MPHLFMVDLLGTEISAEEQIILQHPNVGAVILLTRNYRHPEQLQQLTQAIRSLRPDIFVATDHEGGVVQRFQRQGFRSIPAAHVFGEAYDLNPEVGKALAKKYGRMMALDLLACGIDLSLAPVLDVEDSNSYIIAKLDRAFHQDPQVIVQLAGAFIAGMHDAGMPSVGKHFPGHGSVGADSHIALPVYQASEEAIYHKDLIPFIELIKDNQLDGIMPAHVTYPAIDPNYPAGFSEIWLQPILRQQLRFPGLVISDCLGMTGADIGDMQTRARRALVAGCDMLILCNQSRPFLLEIIQGVSEAHSAESAKRIEGFKQKMRRFSSKVFEPLPADLFATSFQKPEQSRHVSPHAKLNTTDSV